jgi:hypothetical protein
LAATHSSREEIHVKLSPVRFAVVCLLGLATLAAPAQAAQAPPVDVSNAAGCDFLLGAGQQCLAPFPDDWFTVADPSTDTGRRVNFAQASMPANTRGVHIDPQWWNGNDGFPPGSTIIVKVPGLDNAAAYSASKLFPSSDMGASLDRKAPVVVIDAATGQRQIIWTELDANAASDAARNLEIHPGRNLLEGHRYIVALRDLRDASGKRIAAPDPFRIYRDRLRSTQPVVNARRAHMESIFRTLKRAKIGRHSLWAAWDFTVSSERSITSRALAMRNDAFAQLGDTDLGDGKVAGHAPAFTVTKVTDFQPCTTPGGENCPAGTDPDLRRQVEGTVDVPCYLLSPGCASGCAFNLCANGLPVQKPGSIDKAPFVCNIPWSAQDAGGVHRLLPALYGHGLFGSIGEARGSRNVHQLGNENGVVVCATDWQGMADEDEINALPILLDLSGFHALADRLQQGFLNFMFLGRALIAPGGMAGNPAFELGGQPVIDTSHVEYYGNSQGGILGGALTALSPDVTRSVLYVPGMTYSVLLPRSVDFDDPGDPTSFASILYGRGFWASAGGYPDTAVHPLILDLMQMLWDRGEPSGYAQFMTGHPLPDTPRHHVLIEMSIGDHQVANVQAEVEARTIGAKLREPAFDPGRTFDVDPAFGLGVLGRLPRQDDAIIPWDIGPLRQQDGRTMGTPIPPVDNLPVTQGQDPHDYVIEHSPLQRKQIARYMEDGTIIEVCGGQPCRTPDWAGP